MARITYSGLIDSINGAVGGTVFQNNKYGFTVKRKPNIVRPNTALQSKRQAQMSILSRTWRSLTTAQRTAYNTFASSFPQYAKNNPTSELDGYSVFMRYNLLRLQANTAILTTAGSSIPTADSLEWGIKIALGDLVVTMDSVNQDSNWRCLFFVSRKFSAGENFVGTKTRFMTSALNTGDNTNIDTLYDDQYGYVLETGDRAALTVVVIAAANPYVLAKDSDVYTVT